MPSHRRRSLLPLFTLALTLLAVAPASARDRSRVATDTRAPSVAAVDRLAGQLLCPTTRGACPELGQRARRNSALVVAAYTTADSPTLEAFLADDRARVFPTAWSAAAEFAVRAALEGAAGPQREVDAAVLAGLFDGRIAATVASRALQGRRDAARDQAQRSSTARCAATSPTALLQGEVRYAHPSTAAACGATLLTDMAAWLYDGGGQDPVAAFLGGFVSAGNPSVDPCGDCMPTLAELAAIFSELGDGGPVDPPTSGSGPVSDEPGVDPCRACGPTLSDLASTGAVSDEPGLDPCPDCAPIQGGPGAVSDDPGIDPCPHCEPGQRASGGSHWAPSADGEPSQGGPGGGPGGAPVVGGPGVDGAGKGNPGIDPCEDCDPGTLASGGSHWMPHGDDGPGQGGPGGGAAPVQ